MFGLTPGEFGLVAFITIAIVTAKYFPAMGERLALLAAGERRETPDTAEPRNEGEADPGSERSEPP